MVGGDHRELSACKFHVANSPRKVIIFHVSDAEDLPDGPNRHLYAFHKQ